MFLSLQQRFALEVLQKLGCIRQNQLARLMQEKFQDSAVPISAHGVATMIRQLRAGTWDVRADDDLVFLAGTESDGRHLEAIDVMLELSGGDLSDFKIDPASSALLHFSLIGSTLRLFSVFAFTSSLAPRSITRRKMERIIWISEAGQLPETLKLPEKHFFAAREEDGTHRFYGSAEL